MNPTEMARRAMRFQQYKKNLASGNDTEREGNDKPNKKQSGHWVTLHGRGGKGTTRIFLDDDGTILKGPDEMSGRNITELDDNDHRSVEDSDSHEIEEDDVEDENPFDNYEDEDDEDEQDEEGGADHLMVDFRGKKVKVEFNEDGDWRIETREGLKIKSKKDGKMLRGTIEDAKHAPGGTFNLSFKVPASEASRASGVEDEI